MSSTLSSGATGGLFAALGPSAAATWDPDSCARDDKPSKACLTRIRNDLRAVFSDPLPGIMVVPDDTSMLRCHVLITGPERTPYESGLFSWFYFVVQFPVDYPTNPPKVKLLTTGGGTVRFNPNLYRNGKVCLSILGTWSGPGWTPVQTLASVLLSIQSLMNEKPYTNEPGFEQAHSQAVLDDYNDVIAHETLRVSVLENVMQSNTRLHPDMVGPVLTGFIAMREVFADRCDQFAARLDGKPFKDPYRENQGTFVFGKVKERILGEATLKARAVLAELGVEDDDDDAADAEGAPAADEGGTGTA